MCFHVPISLHYFLFYVSFMLWQVADNWRKKTNNMVLGVILFIFFSVYRLFMSNCVSFILGIFFRMQIIWDWARVNNKIRKKNLIFCHNWLRFWLLAKFYHEMTFLEDVTKTNKNRCSKMFFSKTFWSAIFLSWLQWMLFNDKTLQAFKTFATQNFNFFGTFF